MYFLKSSSNSRKYLTILLLCLSFFAAQEALAVADDDILLNDIQQRNYQSLQTKTNNFYASINQAFAIPNFLYGEPLLKPEREESYEQMVDRFFHTYPDIFQNITIGDFRVEIEQPKDRSITQVHLFQTYQNIPAFGAEVIMTFNDRHELISYLGKYLPHLQLNHKPNSTPAAVKQIVTQDLQVDFEGRGDRLRV